MAKRDHVTQKKRNPVVVMVKGIKWPSGQNGGHTIIRATNGAMYICQGKRAMYLTVPRGGGGCICRGIWKSGLYQGKGVHVSVKAKGSFYMSGKIGPFVYQDKRAIYKGAMLVQRGICICQGKGDLDARSKWCHVAVKARDVVVRAQM